MKKILSMAAIALTLASCSNDDENIVIDNGEATNAVAIQISQKVAGVESKAAITPGSNMQAVIMMVDAGSLDADNPDFSAFTPKLQNELDEQNKLNTDDKRATVATTQFEAQTLATTIELTPKLYYPVESGSSTKKTWLFGVSPMGDVRGTIVTFSQTDGLQDVMFADKVDVGSKDNHTTISPLEFKHKTTQLTFVAKLSSDLTDTDWDGKDVTVKNIVIQSAGVPISLDFNGGKVEYKTGTALTVKGCDTKLSTTPCSPSVPVMVQPASGIKVNLELSVGGTVKWYNNLMVKKSGSLDDLVTKEAESHEITFTITPPITASDGTAIEASAKIVDWTVGDAGSVEIK